MDIRGIGNIPGEISQAKKKQSVKADSVPSSNDRIEISDSARAAQEANQLAKAAKAEPEIRQERVEQVRTALADGVLLSSESTKRLADRLADLL